jgi:thioredoxin-related protein
MQSIKSKKYQNNRNNRNNLSKNIFLAWIATSVIIIISNNTFAEQDNSTTGTAKTTTTVPLATNLLATMRFSKKRKLPILLMYSAEDCEYCDRLEEQVIKPMLIDGEIHSKVILRKVMIDGIEKIKDFSGKNIDPEEFADRRGIDVTPTLQFVDALGHELTPKLIGYQGGEFFPAYLTNAITESKEKLNLN